MNPFEKVEFEPNGLDVDELHNHIEKAWQSFRSNEENADIVVLVLTDAFAGKVSEFLLGNVRKIKCCTVKPFSDEHTQPVTSEGDNHVETEYPFDESQVLYWLHRELEGVDISFQLKTPSGLRVDYHFRVTLELKERKLQKAA